MSRTGRHFSFLRFTAFLMIGLLPFALIKFGWIELRTWPLLLTILPGFLLYTILYLLHDRLKKKMKEAGLLAAEHRKGEIRLRPDWHLNLEEKGGDVSNDHPYAWDLSVSGRYSLMQYLDRTVTEDGKRKLLELFLSQPDEEALDASRWKERSAAIHELSRLRVLRNRFRREGYEKNSNRSSAHEWIAELEKLSLPGWMVSPVVFFFAMAVFAATPLLYILFSSGFIKAYFLLTLPVQLLLFIAASFASKNVSKQMSTIADDIPILERLFFAIERFPVHSERLRSLSLFSGRPGGKIKSLSWTAGFFSLRTNPFAHLTAGLFAGYEFILMYRLSRWLRNNSAGMREWFVDLALFDAWISLAEFQSDHPDFTLPELGNRIEAVGMAHPLLHRTHSVANDVDAKSADKIWIITGSNMSGKSTFLRSMGVNLLLAMTGSAVCARKFVFSPVRLYTSMNIVDDPSRGISLFYAEVKRIKRILEECNKDTFIFIDEMLRGTNARERMIASRSILKTISKTGSRGFVSTHDLELTELCQENKGKFHCCHFQEIVADGKMTFDYVIKDGPVQSSNALKILEMEGISIHE